ncbi:MAG TPA: ABC transporter ATP-binding protein [Candidatus Aminicenantes bacterium]|nr:ABC transporter ATP-binding protein [Candidatus Aminicenantes bacterium]
MNSQAIIDIRDISFNYPDGTPGLNSVSLRVQEGDCLGIVGPNGAGKSTLLRHINGVLRGQGEVCVAGMVVERGRLEAVRRQVGMVFQNPDHQLFMPTLMDDVLFGPLNFGLAEAEAGERAEAVLREMGLWELRERSPLHLSLGEKKKAALATVLVMRPAIVVLDEPMVSLDPGSRRRLLQRIGDLDATRVIATHDLEMVMRICNRVVLMNRGMVISAGTPRELFARKELLEANDLEVPFCIDQHTYPKNTDI